MWNFQPSPKISQLSSRVVPPERTEQRVREVIHRIPVTRISNLTPLDPLRLPVFAAVTPLARDLTTHLGKGLDMVSARVSALMEAVERVSAEQPPRVTCYISFADLQKQPGRQPIDPEAFQLPSYTTFARNRAFAWMEGHDLISDCTVVLPADLVLNPPGEGILGEVDTNGLAAGNTRLEAVVHALCEVIERDALSQVLFTTLFAEPEDPYPPVASVDLTTLPETARLWIEQGQSQGLEFVIQYISCDVGVATFRTFIIEHAYPTPSGPRCRRFPGYGTYPNAEAAVLRSITEAVQSRLSIIQGARDSYNSTPTPHRTVTRSAHLRELMPVHRMPFSDIPSFSSSDLLEELTFLLKRIVAAGFQHVVVADLTRSDLGIPVVRVRVPGMSSFLVNRRRVDWRCLRYLL
ncbi:MAG: YcaO-like family protein [Ktedonobacteraceae bacterium]